MKKFVSLMLLAGLMLGVSIVSAQEEPVTVTVMTWEGADTNAAIDAALALFMEANPNIIVERIPSPNSGYGERLSAMQLAGELPDIFWAGNDTEQQYADQGIAFNWAEYAANDENFNADEFAPGALENWTTLDGGLYGLPTLMNTYGVWYNAALFEEAGVELPTTDWTWEEMFAAAEALKDEASGRFGVQGYMLVNPNEAPFTLSNCAVAKGGEPLVDRVINPTVVTLSPEYIECAGLLASAVQSGAATPPGYPGDGQTELFIAGQIPMLVYGQWLAPSFIGAAPEFEYGFAPMPGVEGADAVQPYDAVGIVSPATIENPDAVWEVTKFLATDAWTTILPTAPVAPAAHVPSSEAYFQTLADAGLQSAADAINYELSAPTKQAIRFTAPWSSQANDVLNARWNDILTGAVDLEEGLTTMVEELNGVIEANAPMDATAEATPEA